MNTILFVVAFIGAAASVYVPPEGFPAGIPGGYGAPIVKAFKPKVLSGYVPISAPVVPIVKTFQPKIIGGYQSPVGGGYHVSLAGGYHSAPIAASPIVPFVKTFQPKIIADYKPQVVPLSVKAPVVVAPFANIVKVKKFQPKFFNGYEASSVATFHPKLVGGYQDPLSVSAPVDYSADGASGFGYKEVQGGFSGEGFGYDLWKKKKAFA